MALNLEITEEFWKSACVIYNWMFNVPRRYVNTTWKKYVEEFCIYIEIDLSIGRERSLVDERDLSHMV